MNRALAQAFPHVYCELDFTSPLELAVATILSAQSTDKRVNLTTPALFKRYRTALDYAQAGLYKEAGEILVIFSEGKQQVPTLIFYYQAWFALRDGRPDEALNLYRLDNSGYPTTDQGLQALVSRPGTMCRHRWVRHSPAPTTQAVGVLP